ncbi:MAG: malate synthase G [Porticoccaceae bacterium]|nr:malate synthase G [Porticoccaceae bacterium]
MTNRVERSGLQIAKPLFELVSEQICPASGVKPDEFWSTFSAIVHEYAPKNIELLEKRETLQAQIDAWHRQQGADYDFSEYKSFLEQIGYLVPEGEDFEISPTQVDPEIALQAGPQLVVPIMNARFALNAVNARWGSLYDALYGNDVIAEDNGAEKQGAYNPVRGQAVVDYGRQFLDQAAALDNGSHAQAVRYSVEDGQLVVFLASGTKQSLEMPSQLVGYRGGSENPSTILLKNNSLHIEIQVDSSHHVGATDMAGVKDIVLEAALTTIMDCEDSVAAVDAEDKVLAYRNWLGLIDGSLTETISRGGKSFERSMNSDREYVSPAGKHLKLSGRSLMFVRNVGHLMTNPAILYGNGQEIPEGIMDGMITSLISMQDLHPGSPVGNSATGSIYIVKPKMHGPEEVAFTDSLFNAIENALGLARHSIKVGIMDEERRTSVNLKECIRAAKDRVVFINTGFLDRTGDEIHTSMQAGPFALKSDLKSMPWILAYENQNVDVGLVCGFKGRAQIGKGMWPVPDKMADMMTAKIAHPQSGANTAWVPSPTAATLHAMHYHQVNVPSLQEQLLKRPQASVDEILTVPLLGNKHLSDEQIQLELDNNAQGLLGYVVRWIDQGVGCSKVPDINNVGLMEDRATLRISSQHMANWLHHGICSPEQVLETLQRMAAIVDQQNSGDSDYINMSPNFSQSIAFQAACDLVFKGVKQPSGYTEPLLHSYRQKAKAIRLKQGI